MSRDGATVFVGGSESDSSHDGKLYAVDASTGIQKWSFATGGSVYASLAVSFDGATVFVGSDDANLYAVDTSAVRSTRAMVMPVEMSLEYVHCC